MTEKTYCIQPYYLLRMAHLKFFFGFKQYSTFFRFCRWCLVHLPICRFFRSLLRITTYGDIPPAMLHLSDGGHFENYGLLPLLKMRLPKILVVHGMKIPSDDDDYAIQIIEAMEHARKLFNFSFTSLTGGDVLTDIKKEFVEKRSRKYEFIVHYSTNSEGRQIAKRTNIVSVRIAVKEDIGSFTT